VRSRSRAREVRAAAGTEAALRKEQLHVKLSGFGAAGHLLARGVRRAGRGRHPAAGGQLAAARDSAARPPSRDRLARLRRDSRRLLRDRQYGGNALAIGFSNAALITYISALPFIVEDAYGRSPQLFSLAFAINALGLTIMSQVGARAGASPLADGAGPRRPRRPAVRRRRDAGRGADRSPAARGFAGALVRVRRRAGPRRPGSYRRHRLGVPGRTAVPARRGDRPGIGSRRPRRRHPGSHHHRRADRWRGGRPGADHPESTAC
jgi:hypothetical protein